MLLRLLLLLALAPAMAPRLLAEDEAPAVVELRMKYGDDARWAAPGWDDHDWTVMPPDGFPVHAGIYWVRFRLVRPAGKARRPAAASFYNYAWPSDERGAPIDCVVFNPMFSFDFFWDGRLLERGGAPGNSLAAEVVGPLDHLIHIPDDLRGPGEHVVALRLSTYHYNHFWLRPTLPIHLGNYASQLRDETRRPFLPLIGAGLALLSAIACLGLTRLFAQRRALLLSSALGLALALFYALVAMRWVYNAPYDWHTPRLNILTFVMAAIGLLLPWVLAEHFDLPRRGRWLAGLTPLLALSSWVPSPYQDKAFWLSRTMLMAALAIALWAARQRKPGAVFVLVAAGIGLLIATDDGRALLDTTYFVIVNGVLLFVLAAIVRQFQRERRQSREAVLTTARLETELLKKNLQPHFLLNTLTAISEVIEQDPAGAVRFIEDLADEFRSFARMSGEQLVTLEEEIALCRAHLRVINQRMGRAYDLIVVGADPAARVPPAVFLTLIENGLVHQQVGDDATFRLRAAAAAPGLTYVFVSPGTARESAGRPPGGTGLRYVKARLEESFPGRWSFAHHATAAGWETVIELRAAPGAGGGA